MYAFNTTVYGVGITGLTVMGVNMGKRMVREVLERGFEDCFECPLDELVSGVSSLVVAWREEYRRHSNLRLERVANEYDEGYGLALIGDREETDEEYAERVGLEDPERALRRRMYEQLKEEFEG